MKMATEIKIDFFISIWRDSPFSRATIKCNFTAHKCNSLLFREAWLYLPHSAEKASLYLMEAWLYPWHSEGLILSSNSPSRFKTCNASEILEHDHFSGIGRCIVFNINGSVQVLESWVGTLHLYLEQQRIVVKNLELSVQTRWPRADKRVKCHWLESNTVQCTQKEHDRGEIKTEFQVVVTSIHEIYWKALRLQTTKTSSINSRARHYIERGNQSSVMPINWNEIH